MTNFKEIRITSFISRFKWLQVWYIQNCLTYPYFFWVHSSFTIYTRQETFLLQGIYSKLTDYQVHSWVSEPSKNSVQRSTFMGQGGCHNFNRTCKWLDIRKIYGRCSMAIPSSLDRHALLGFENSGATHLINGKSRILKWRYVSTI